MSKQIRFNYTKIQTVISFEFYNVRTPKCHNYPPTKTSYRHTSLKLLFVHESCTVDGWNFVCYCTGHEFWIVRQDIFGKVHASSLFWRSAVVCLLLYFSMNHLLIRWNTFWNEVQRIRLWERPLFRLWKSPIFFIYVGVALVIFRKIRQVEILLRIFGHFLINVIDSFE